MELPIRFPTDAEVIAEEVARFRALTPNQRVQSIRSLLSAGARLMASSPKSSFLVAQKEADEEANRQAFLSAVAKYGR